MLREYTCIVCPNGCTITAQTEAGKIVSLQGGDCKCGQQYVTQEITSPLRTISSSIHLLGGSLPLVSVRLTSPIPKDKIFAVMSVIKKASLTAPVYIGQVAIKNILGLDCDVIVTKNISEK